MQQAYLCGVGVLVLVDEHGVVAPGQLRRHLGALGEQDRPVDQFRVVEDALGVEHVEVLGEELGRGAPVRAARTAGEGGQRVGAEAQLTAAGQHRAHLVGEATGRQTGPQLVGPADMGRPGPLQAELACQKLTHGDVLLGSGEQAQRIGEEVGVLVGADQGVAVGVEGGGLRAPGAAEPGRHPVAEFDGRLAAEGEDEDAGGIGPPGHAPRDRLHQRRGLAGARSGEDQERSVPVVNHGALRCVQERGSTEPGGVRTSRYAPGARRRA